MASHVYHAASVTFMLDGVPIEMYSNGAVRESVVDLAEYKERKRLEREGLSFQCSFTCQELPPRWLGALPYGCHDE